MEWNGMGCDGMGDDMRTNYIIDLINFCNNKYIVDDKKIEKSNNRNLGIHNNRITRVWIVIGG